MFKYPPTRSSGTYSFVYIHGMPRSESEHRWPSLKNQAQVFFNGLLRLLVPTMPGEPHNFMPDYQGYELYHHLQPAEARFKGLTRPFYRVHPTLIAPAFEAGEAKNLGALLFLNSLTNSTFSKTSLHIVQSQTTQAYYFTQLLSPSWLACFDRGIAPALLEPVEIHETLRASITSFLRSAHPEWWASTGLLRKADLIVDYENILLEEILITMFRLYLTPMSIIDHLMSHFFRASPQETRLLVSLKIKIRDTISRFQSVFIQSILPTITSDDMEDKFLKLYTNYVHDMHHFKLFPFEAFQSYFDKKTLNSTECQVLTQAIKTQCAPAFFVECAFDKYLDLTNYYFDEMLFDRAHFLWHTLELLAESLSCREVSQYEIILDENLRCLLIKSIEFQGIHFPKFILAALGSGGKLLEVSQCALGERISRLIHQAGWRNYGLLDVADATENKAIQNYLQKAGASCLSSFYSSESASSPLFFATDEEAKRETQPRGRSKAYANLSEYFSTHSFT